MFDKIKKKKEEIIMLVSLIQALFKKGFLSQCQLLNINKIGELYKIFLKMSSKFYGLMNKGGGL